MTKKTRTVTGEKRTPSKAYVRFEGVIERSLNLLSLQTLIENVFSAAGDPRDLSDMARTTVVLAVSAMDAYLTGIFAERLVPFLKKKEAPRALVALLEDAQLGTKVALDLLRMQRPYRRVRKLIDSYLARQVTQRMDTINRLFSAYGLKNFCQQIEKKARRKTLLASVRILVQRRHDIAHKGDLNSHGRLKKINPVRIKTRVMDVVKFVSCADELLQKQLS